MLLVYMQSFVIQATHNTFTTRNCTNRLYQTCAVICCRVGPSYEIRLERNSCQPHYLVYNPLTKMNKSLNLAPVTAVVLSLFPVFSSYRGAIVLTNGA